MTEELQKNRMTSEVIRLKKYIYFFQLKDQNQQLFAMLFNIWVFLCDFMMARARNCHHNYLRKAD